MKSDPPAPTSFDNRFRDWKLLSEGAEGVLYRVTDRWTGRVCALKVAKPSDQARDGLIQEFRLLSHLRHPCLIESLGLVRDGELLGHLLEYVPVVPSHEIFERGGEDAVRAAFVQALRGVHYLHRQGWLHTDISPGNILVWQEGDSWRAKVADLGLVYRAEEAEGLNPRGTVETMSPEVARGEGARPESDWFGLGATLVSWIDGSLWSGSMSSRDILREVAAVKEPLQARKRVDSEFAKWITEVTQPEPSRRHIPAWDQLRRNADAWGPDVLVGGLHGLDATTSALESWLQEVPQGQVGAIVLQGRVGTGRRTLGRLMARTLVASGWVGLTEMSLGTVSDWLGEDEPDPVRLARELSRRYKGVDLVVSWLSDVGELESRLYEALIASRAQSEGDQHRTVVIKVEGRGERASWLNRLPWVREESWSGVSSDALEQIAADLYAEETGMVDDSSGSPLSLEMGKRAFLSGREAVSGEAVASVESDTLLALSNMREESRLALSVLSASGEPWAEDQLVNLLEIEKALWSEIVSELRNSLLVESVYSRGEEGLTVPDWLVRDVMTNRFAEEVSQESAQSILDRLQTRGRSSEISLLIACLSTGAFRNDLVLGVLRDGLQEGQYESVVKLYKAAEDSDGFDVAAGAEIALRAAERLGKFQDQVYLLRKIAERDGENITRVRLSKALFDAGLTSEAIQIAKLGTEDQGKPSANGLFNLGNLAWQTGDYELSDEVFETLQELGLDELLELDLMVSRARSMAARGKMSSAEAILGSIKNELASSHVQYLRTKAGLLQAQGQVAEARDLVSSAMQISEDSHSWQNFLEASLRRASSEMALGNMRLASRVSSEIESTAIALGSDRMQAFANHYIALSLNSIGHVEDSLLRAKQVHRYGVQKQEEIMAGLGAAHVLQVSMDWGLYSESESAIAALEKTKYPTIEGNKLRFLSKQAFYRGDFPVALDLLNEARDHFLRRGYVDDVVENEPLRIVSMKETGDSLSAKNAFESLDIERYPRFRPAAKLVGLIVGGECNNTLVELISEFARLGQNLDLYRLAPSVLKLAKTGNNPRTLLAAKQVIHALLEQLVANVQGIEFRQQLSTTRHFSSCLELLSE